MIETTVVIPNLNGMKYLEDCLNSLYACEEQSFPVIVVDNGSTDGSVALIQERFPQTELICSIFKLLFSITQLPRLITTTPTIY